MNKLSNALLEYRDTLNQTYSMDIIIGKPYDLTKNTVSDSIYFFPWKLDLDVESLKSNSRRKQLENSEVHSTKLPNLQFLIMVQSMTDTDTTIRGINFLEYAYEKIVQNTIMTLYDGTKCQVYLNELTTEQLTAIFNSASLQLNLCLNATLRLI